MPTTAHPLIEARVLAARPARATPVLNEANGAFLTITQAAGLAGVSRPTIAGWIGPGCLPAAKIERWCHVLGAPSTAP